MNIDFEGIRRMMAGEKEAKQVAARLIWLAADSGRELTPMQLVKLAYISHGWMLGLLGKPLFSEPVEAWRYGPVVPSIYHKYKEFRARPITWQGNPYDEEIGEEGCNIVDQVAKGYGACSGLALSDMTHTDDSPWAIVRRRGEQVIPNVLIQAHYERLAARQQEGANG